MKKEATCLACSQKFVYNDTQSTGKYCNNRCQHDYQYQQYVSRWKSGKESGMRGKVSISKHIRRYLHEKHNGCCCKCGWSKMNPVTNKVPLEINHKDGDIDNNAESNLELLCPNCHSLTPNFGVLNAGKGKRGKKNVRTRD